MRAVFSWIVASIVFLSFGALAASDSSVSVEDLECSQTLGLDPYETPTRIGEGSRLYSGQCIDSNRFRPARVISETSEEIVIANYQHENQFWKATLSKKAVIEEIMFHIVRFQAVGKVQAAHTQFRIRLSEKTPLLLVSQGPSHHAPESKTIGDLVISYEAARPKDVDYNFAYGADPNYLLVARVLSGRQRLWENPESPTEQYSMAIPEAPENEKMLMVLNALRKSSKELLSRFYNTLRPNCTTEIFDLIDALPSQQASRQKAWVPRASFDPVAGPSLEGLEVRGLQPTWLGYLAGEDLFGVDKMDPPEIKQADGSFLANVPGAPYSVVVALDKNLENSPVKQKAKKLTYELIPEVMQKVMAATMISALDGSSPLSSSLETLAPLVQSKFEELNSELTEEPLFLSIYLVPWKGAGKHVDLTEELDLNLELSFKNYETTFDQLSDIHDGLVQASLLKSKSGEPFGLLSVAAHLKLVKDHSQANLQILGALGPLKKPFPNESDAAVITHVKIPHWAPLHKKRLPMVLANFSVTHNKELPDFNMEFGPYTIEDEKRQHLGALSVSPESCIRHSRGTPRLLGKVSIPLKEWTKKLGTILPVGLHITRLDFDLATQTVSNADVDVKPTVPLLGLACLRDVEEASSQVENGINTELEKLTAQLKEYSSENKDKLIELGFSFFSSLLSNNESGAVAGSEMDEGQE